MDTLDCRLAYFLCNPHSPFEWHQTIWKLLKIENAFLFPFFLFVCLLSWDKFFRLSQEAALDLCSLAFNLLTNQEKAIVVSSFVISLENPFSFILFHPSVRINLPLNPAQSKNLLTHFIPPLCVGGVRTGFVGTYNVATTEYTGSYKHLYAIFRFRPTMPSSLPHFYYPVLSAPRPRVELCMITLAFLPDFYGCG